MISGYQVVKASSFANMGLLKSKTHGIVGKVLRACGRLANGVAAEGDPIHKRHIERRVLRLPTKLPRIAAWCNKQESIALEARSVQDTANPHP